MKIRVIRPCSENAGKVIVKCHLGYCLQLQKFVDLLRGHSTEFRRILYFESSNLLWLKQNGKTILVNSNGEVTVNGADSVDEAVKVVQEIENVEKLMQSR